MKRKEQHIHRTKLTKRMPDGVILYICKCSAIRYCTKDGVSLWIK